MPILVKCPSCGRKLRAQDQHVGRRLPCPKCGKGVTISGESVPPYDVFLSYSAKDKPVADAVCATLEQKGFRCWIAPRDIVAGKGWSESIIEGIEQSRLLVLVFSANSNASQQVIREVERAVAKRIPIIPFRVENLAPSKAMEYFISSQHWLDAYTPPLEKHLEHLAQTVHVLLKGSDVPHRPGPKEDPAAYLKAAVKSLFARDHRPRVLLALTGLLLLAALAVAGVFWAFRTPTASAEVIQAKADAERAWKEVKSLDRAAFGPQLDEIEARLEAGQASFDQKDYKKALAAFQEVIDKGARSAYVAEARRFDTSKLKVVNQEAWQQIEQAVTAGEKADQEGQHTEAAQKYQEALRLFRENAVPQVKYLCFWTGFAARTLCDNKFDRAVPIRLRNPGLLPQNLTVPRKDRVERALDAFQGECRPQLRLDLALCDRFLGESDAERAVDLANGELYKAVEKAAGAQAGGCYWVGYDLAMLCAFLECMVQSGSDIHPYPHLRYEPGKFEGYVRDLLLAAYWGGLPGPAIDRIDRARKELTRARNAVLSELHMVETPPEFERCLDLLRTLYTESLNDPAAAARFFRQPAAKRPRYPGGDELVSDLRRLGAVVYPLPTDSGAPRIDVESFKGENTGRVLQRLKGLPGLASVWLSVAEVNGKALAPLKDHADLRQLTLVSTQVTDDGMQALKSLTHLEELELLRLPVTDKGVGQLSALTALKRLGLHQTKVTAGGIAALKQALPSLKIEADKGLETAGQPEGSPKTEPVTKPLTGKPPTEVAVIKTEFQNVEAQANIPRLLALSRGGKMVAMGGSEGLDVVNVWDRASREKLATWRLQRHAVTKQLQFGLDERHLFVDFLGAMDIKSGESTPYPEDLGWAVSCFALAPDGKRAAVGLHGAKETETKVLRFVKLPELTELHSAVETFEGQLQAVAFSPDGNRLAAALREKGGHKLMLLDPKTGAERATLEEFRAPDTLLYSGIIDVVFSPDGTTLATYGQYGSDDRRIILWDPATGKPRKTIKELLWTMEFIAGGRLLAALHDGQGINHKSLGVFVYDAASGELRSRNDHFFSGMDVVCGVRGILAWAKPDSGEVTLWDLLGNRLAVKFKAHAGPVLRIAFSPDGKFMATFGKENKLKVWSLD
jgi:WD40 repeat protein/tetratricopeptide (TPR) repeat protein